MILVDHLKNGKIVAINIGPETVKIGTILLNNRTKETAAITTITLYGKKVDYLDPPYYAAITLDNKIHPREQDTLSIAMKGSCKPTATAISINFVARRNKGNCDKH